MNPAVIAIVVYFVGIAAVVDGPGAGKTVIFPQAQLGTYGGLILAPHRTFLHLRGDQLADVADPQQYCEQTIGGSWSNGICSLALAGATVAVESNQGLQSPDPSFGKMPRFQDHCNAVQTAPKRPYLEADPDPDFVAARYQVTDGKLSGCNRCGGAFVTKLEVASSTGALTVRRAGTTLTIRLKSGAAVAVENRPTGTAAHASHPPQNGRTHYGWYYFIASGTLTCPIAPPTKPAPVGGCGEIPGVETPPCHGEPSASGPDCGNTTYP